MFSTTGTQIINDVRIFLNDTDSANYRWSDATLLAILNMAQRDLALRIWKNTGKAALRKDQVVELEAGTRQNLDNLSLSYTPLGVLDVDFNVGVSWVDETSYTIGDIVVDTSNGYTYKSDTVHTGAGTGTSPASDSTNWTRTQENRNSGIEHMHKANVDQLIIGWESSNTDSTDQDGTEVEFWSEDQYDDLIFHVEPQQPDSDYKMNVKLIYAAVPASLGSVGASMELEDKYRDAIVFYTVSLAFAQDDEVDQNGNTNSGKWFNLYANNPVFL